MEIPHSLGITEQELEKAAELMGPAADEIEWALEEYGECGTAIVEIGQYQNVSAVSGHHEDAGVPGADSQLAPVTETM